MSSHSQTEPPQPCAPNQRNILIYDSSLSGHHPDYLKAILAHCQTQPHLICTFMVPAEFVKEHQSETLQSHIRFRALTAHEMDKINHLDVRAQACFELELIAAQLNTCSASGTPFDESILMYLDYFQPVLGARQGEQFPVNISGVLFQPYTRVEAVATQGSLQLGLFAKALRKRYRLFRMLRGGKVKRICVPCDERAVSMLNERHSKYARFEMLPEPYSTQPIPGAALNDARSGGEGADSEGSGGDIRNLDIRTKYGISPEKRVVLAFGRMISRKNVPRIIDAFQSLDASTLANTSLLIIGTASSDYQSILQQRVEQARVACPAAQIIYDHQFADDSLMEAAFAQCDLVAMPYLKAYQSSGVLFLAARYRKPVLAANSGLISELVENYNLGLTVDVVSTQSIADGIRGFTETSFYGECAIDFLMRHTPQFHAEVILDLPH